MLYQFKSRATGSVFMIQSVAEHVLAIIGKEPGQTGIITVEQIPAAIAALHKAVEESEASPQDTRESNGDGNGHDEEQNGVAVSLAQRAYPFIEMLEDAHRAGKDVTWGV